VTGCRRALRQRLDDLARTHLRRSEKPMRRDLTRPIAANLAQHQRAGGNDPVKQPSAARRASPNSPIPSNRIIDAPPTPSRSMSAA
jgi:hypothetical protein